MPAIGTVWRTGTWDTDAWAANTWENAAAPVVVEYPPSPTRASHNLVNTESGTVDFGPTMASYEPINTRLGALDADGVEMATPLTFTQNETGPITLFCEGADGTRENLATASSVTLRVVRQGGTAVVDNVALTSPTADGTAVWTRTALQVATPGDYRWQIKVVRADATVGYYPDGQVGNPLTILPAV